MPAIPFPLPLQFGNWSLLVDYINNDANLSSKMTLQWATLSEYFEAQLNLSQIAYPDVYPGTDYVPYNFLDFWAYWSGFYVSRPVLKGIIRYLHSELQSTERMFTLAKGLYPKGMATLLLLLRVCVCSVGLWLCCEPI